MVGARAAAVQGTKSYRKHPVKDGVGLASTPMVGAKLSEREPALQGMHSR